MADKHRVRIERRVNLLLQRDADEIVEPAELNGLAVNAGRAEVGGRLRLDADQRQILEIGSVIAVGLRTGESELRGEIFGSQIAAAGAHAAPFEQIARQEFHVCADARAGNFMGLRRGGRGKEDDEECTFHDAGNGQIERSWASSPR